MPRCLIPTISKRRPRRLLTTWAVCKSFGHDLTCAAAVGYAASFDHNFFQAMLLCKDRAKGNNPCPNKQDG